MSETVTVFTVPDDWTEKSRLSSNSSDAIVGTVTPKGDELWLPHDPNENFIAGGYSAGYSPTDVQESSITLGEGMSARFTAFFDKILLGDKEERSDLRQRGAKYDCHWFANWLDGQTDQADTVIDSVRAAKRIVKQGAVVESTIDVGAIGVLTRISKTRNVYPAHSFVAIDESRAVHAMGRNGILAISPQNEIFAYYTEHCHKQLPGDKFFEDPNKLHLYTTSSNA